MNAKPTASLRMYGQMLNS